MKKINKTIAILNEQLKNQAIAVVESLPFDPQYKVVISGYKECLSDNQRRLYFMWIGIIGAELGYTKDEMHKLMKKEFLVGIYERDPEKPEYSKTIQTLRELWKEKKEDAEFLFEQVVNMTSITDASIENMIEYLTEIDNKARGLNIPLPHPEDLRWQ